MSERHITPVLRLAMLAFPRRVREHRGEEMRTALADVSNRRGLAREALPMIAGGLRLRFADWRDRGVSASAWDALMLSAVLALALMLRPVVHSSALAWEFGTTAVWGHGWDQWALATGLWVVPLLALLMGRNRVAAITLVPVTAVHLLRVGDAAYGTAVGRLPLLLAPLLITLVVIGTGRRTRRPGWIVPVVLVVSAVWIPMSFLNEPGGRQLSSMLTALFIVAALVGLAAPRWGLAVTLVWALLASGAALNIPVGDETWNPSTFGLLYYLVPCLLAVPAVLSLHQARRRSRDIALGRATATSEEM